MTKVLLIYTGGTIGMHRNPLTAALEPFNFEHLLQNVPELSEFSTQIDTYQFQPPIDSSDMSPARWTDIAHVIADHYDAYDGFVVLHGTDTMAYTASALSYMLENLTKPVIFTGSQLPIGQLRTDGKENLITSIEIASSKDSEGHARVPEVGIYFGGHLLRGNRTTKQSAEEFNAFESFNYPHLVDAGVNITYHQARILKPNYLLPMTPHFSLDNNVIIFSLFPGIREDLIAHLRQRQRTSVPLAAQCAQGRHCQRQGHCQHQPVHAGCCRNVALRLRLSPPAGRCSQRFRQHRRECGHQAHVPPGTLHRPRGNTPLHDTKHPWRNLQVKRIFNCKETPPLFRDGYTPLQLPFLFALRVSESLLPTFSSQPAWLIDERKRVNLHTDFRHRLKKVMREA